MRCYYCKKECEGLAFQQLNLIVIAHRQCAEEKVKADGSLIITDQEREAK